MAQSVFYIDPVSQINCDSSKLADIEVYANLQLSNYNVSLFNSSQRHYQNIGSVNVPLGIRTSFFNIGYDIYNYYNLNSSFYSLDLKERYYSQIKFLLGTRKEQMLSIEHQQKIYKGLSLGIIYRSIGSPGFYNRQLNSITNFTAKVNFESQDKSYVGTISYFTNRIIAQENGGIVYDSLLEVFGGQERSVPVNLFGSEHRIRTKGVVLNQSYNFIKHCGTDSTNEILGRAKFVGVHYLGEVSRQSFVFIDSEIDSGFYMNNNLLDTLGYDSLVFKKFTNEFDFLVRHFRIFNRHEFFEANFKMGGEVNFYKSHQYVLDTSFYNNSINAVLSFGNLKKWNLTSSFRKLIDSRNKKPYIFDTRLVCKFNTVISKSGLSFINQTLPPEYISELFYSNHFIWRNDFKNRKETVIKLFANFFNDQFSFSVSRYFVNGYIYNDEFLKTPVQDQSNLEITKGQLDINYKLFKWHLVSENIYNFSVDNAVIRFPKFDLSNTVYYKDQFFKKALTASIGAQCHYQSAFYANAFNPATGQTYIQNEVKIGDYPYVHVFLDIEIKSAKLFFKVEHINAGMGDRNYFYMPHYPTPPRTFKFGLEWTFRD